MERSRNGQPRDDLRKPDGENDRVISQQYDKQSSTLRVEASNDETFAERGKISRPEIRPPRTTDDCTSRRKKLLLDHSISRRETGHKSRGNLNFPVERREKNDDETRGRARARAYVRALRYAFLSFSSSRRLIERRRGWQGHRI